MRLTARTGAFIIHRRRVQEKYTVRLLLPTHEEHSIAVGADEFILTAAYREGVDLPSMCLQGWCITCAGRVQSPQQPNTGLAGDPDDGEGAWDQSESLRFYEEDFEAGFILLCTAKPRSDLAIRTHQREAMRDHRLECGLPVPRG